MAKRTSFTLPTTFDKFELLRELGRGATGTVYFAHQDTLDRDLAIKILSPDFSHDEDFISRFQREGRIAASLRHPNIIQLIDASVCDDLYYIAMEYVAGSNLREVLRKNEIMDWRKAVEIVCQVLNALEHAHSKGIVHRDVKPANILLEEGGRAVLTDFSVAHMKAASRLTATGALLGTPEYMAPEQFEGAAVDKRSDIYAIGLILYELVTGTNPFRARTIPEILKLQLFSVPKSPEQINSSIPLPVAQLIKSVLNKNPDERIASAAELARKLERAAEASMSADSGPPSLKIKLGGEELSSGELQSKTEIQVEPEPTEVTQVVENHKNPKPASPFEEVEAGRPWLAWIGILALGAAVAAAILLKTPPASGPTASPTSPTSPTALAEKGQGESEGEVVVSATPQALEVSVDGQPPTKFSSGFRLNLKPGAHRITANAPGFVEKTVEVEVAAGGKSDLQLVLEGKKGTLKFARVPQKVSWSYNDEPLRPLTEASVSLAPGTYRLRFARQGYGEVLRNIELVPGGTVSVSELTFVALPVKVRIDSQPSGSRVVIDGKVAGATPLEKVFKPGLLKVSIEREGYETARLELKVEAGNPIKKEVKLKALPPPEPEPRFVPERRPERPYRESPPTRPARPSGTGGGGGSFPVI